MEGASLARQIPYAGVPLQTAATATGNGVVADTNGINGAIYVELVNTGSASAVGVAEGSHDGTNWYQIGFYVTASGASSPAAGNAALARVVGAVTVAATTVAGSLQILQLLDYFPNIRFRISTASAGCSLNVKLHGIPT